jgi:hypothetical protein
MTRRQQAIEDAAMHLYSTNGITTIYHKEKTVVELLTETGHVDVIDDYDWPRLREAVCRRYREIREKVNRGREARQRLSS